MVQDAASQNPQIIEVAERLRNLLQNLKDLNAKQWRSIDGDVLSNVFLLLYCCIMECRELQPTPLAISSLCHGLVASNLALHGVHGAALVNQNDKTSVSSQQQRVMNAIEEAILNSMKDTREPDCATAFGDMHVSFGGGNRGIRAAEYRGSMHLTFPL
ncbi:hypothetical protein PENANT_c224G01029 [Penicillium antarcticum]|uniref:Uncharacterized protein n=1 Tax=Penicillium antarcticum TaxID=416450 RepID=A0A1V6P6T9_9EURO|nr:hypothetical protein PENANT_c224G01029 [Penicillium antarcticum]